MINMTDQQIYELLMRFDRGYSLTNIARREICQIKRLHWAGIAQLPRCIKLLLALEELDLSWNEALTDIDALSGLPNLTILDLRSTQVSNINALSRLTMLKKLSLRSTQVREIGMLSGLSGLKSLDLCKTHVRDISVLSNLHELTSIDLSFTGVNDISSLANLEKLTELCLQDTEINEISLLSGLTSLSNLDLRGTEVKDISPLVGLNKITHLDLRGLSISQIPEGLVDLGLEFIADEIPFFRKPGIYIHGLTLTDQPIGIFHQKREDILEYFKTTKCGSDPINECKVVFLGNGGAGKSLIIDRLMHDGKKSEGFNGESTPGVNIRSKVYLVEGEKIEFHFWDFGGQDIMHSMHRLFLTNRTLYVIVVNAREGKINDQARYWIRNINSFAMGSPFLLVLNHKDQCDSVDINQNGLEREYSTLKDVKIISALKDDTDVFNTEIQATICEIVSKMDSVHTQFPRSWLLLMNNLQKMKDDFIMSDSFYEKCREIGIETTATVIDEIVNWYQDLGVCFYSSKHPTFRQYMVLKPEWLLNALYIIVFNGRKFAKNGVIGEKSIYKLICGSNPDLEIRKVWGEIDYKESQVQYILNVFLNYELIFRLNNGQDQNEEYFFIPMLCDENEPKKIEDYESGESIHVSFIYEYLPENVLHKFMVRHGYELNNGLVWRTGAVLNNYRCGWTALVQKKGDRLEVFAKSRNPETHPLNVYLDMMRESIYKINDSFGIVAKEFITYHKNDLKDCFDYELLISSIEYGRHTIFSKVFRNEISIEEILGIVSVQKRVFGQGFDSQINALLHTVADALLKLQDNKYYYGAEENDCNKYVCDMIEQRGYICYDQSKHAVSGTGKKSGSVDIWIQDRDSKKDLSIYEAQWLKSFSKKDKDSLEDHLKRLLVNYNKRGLRNLLLVSYVAWKDISFNDLANQYCSYVIEGAFTPFSIVESRLLDTFSDTFLRCLKVGYDCGGTTMFVYHMIVRVAA